MPELVDDKGRIEKIVFQPIRGLKTEGHQIGTSREAIESEKKNYEAIIEDSKNQKAEDSIRLVDSKLVVAAIAEHTTEKGGLENILEKLNVGPDSDVRGMIEENWETLTMMIQDKEKQQAEVDDITETLGKIKNPNGDNYKETEEKLGKAKETLTKIVGEVNRAKEGPQTTVDELEETISYVEGKISEAEKIVIENESIIESIQVAELNYSANQSFYKDFYRDNDEYINTIVGEIEDEEVGIYSASVARQKSSRYLMIANLRNLIDKATSKGLFSFIVDSLTDIEIHILLMHKYSIEELPGGYDVTTKSSLYVPGKKVKVKTPDDTPDLKVSWDKNITGGVMDVA